MPYECQDVQLWRLGKSFDGTDVSRETKMAIFSGK